MTSPPRFIRTRYRREILDHLGTCPVCGYPSQAHVVTTEFLSGDHESTLFVTCGLSCGWQQSTPS
ncbi:hypothetical protein ACWEOI_31560 [Nocardia sp. NPDC004340]